MIQSAPHRNGHPSYPSPPAWPVPNYAILAWTISPDTRRRSAASPPPSSLSPPTRLRPSPGLRPRTWAISSSPCARMAGFARRLAQASTCREGNLVAWLGWAFVTATQHASEERADRQCARRGGMLEPGCPTASARPPAFARNPRSWAKIAQSETPLPFPNWPRIVAVAMTCPQPLYSTAAGCIPRRWPVFSLPAIIVGSGQLWSIRK